jgi:hypothetical protein
MHPVISKYLSKLFIQQWVIGVGKCHPGDILENKTFDPAIKWMEVPSADRFIADPFLLQVEDNKYRILYEDYTFTKGYGHIAELEVTERPSVSQAKKILDTGTHLSYPFIFREADRVFVFPEAAQSGKLTCYEYHSESSKLEPLKVILEQPVLDSTIIKKDGRYWLFCTMLGPGEDRQLHLFFADQLLGNYQPHPGNPVKDDLSGSRPAGALIAYKGEWYRPAQDSRYTYGGGMVINKITKLDEQQFEEEFYMRIIPGKTSGIRGMHTLNFTGDLLVADGTRWRFAPVVKARQLMMKFSDKNKKKEQGQ